MVRPNAERRTIGRHNYLITQAASRLSKTSISRVAILSIPSFLFNSLLIRYAQTCFSCECFITTAMRLFKLASRTWIRYGTIENVEVQLTIQRSYLNELNTPLTNDVLKTIYSDNIHRTLHKSMTLTNMTFYRSMRRAFATGVECREKVLTPPNSLSRPI